MSYIRFISLMAAVLFSPPVYAQACTSHGDCTTMDRGRCINGTCAATSCTETDNPCPSGTYCDFSVGNCLPDGSGGGPSPNNTPQVPEMSETLALGFLAAAGGLVFYLRRKRSKAGE